MRTKRLVYLGVVAAGIAAFLASWPSQLSSQQGTSVSIDNDDIGGVVTGPKGPEAGVWVIAETTDLPTRFAKIVVTDDRALRGAGPAEGQLQRLGARLRPGRFAEGAERAGQAAQSDGGAGAERGGGGAVLSGDLLVLDAEDPGRRASSAARDGIPANDHPDRLAQHR